MINFKNFFIFLLLFSILGGFYSLREITKPKPKEVFFNTSKREVVVIDSIKNDTIFTHSIETKTNFTYKESLFPISHKKIK